MYDYIADEKNFKGLQSYIAPHYGSRKDYIDKMKFPNSTHRNEVTKFAIVQITGEDALTFLNGRAE